jgi:hypothetical protein
MPYINVDIDLGTIYDDLSSSEKDYLVDWLKEDGHIEEPEVNEFPSSENYKDDDWVETIQKLAKNRHQLTLEEEELIKSISNKLA